MFNNIKYNEGILNDYFVYISLLFIVFGMILDKWVKEILYNLFGSVWFYLVWVVKVNILFFGNWN